MFLFRHTSDSCLYLPRNAWWNHVWWRPHLNFPYLPSGHQTTGIISYRNFADFMAKSSNINGEFQPKKNSPSLRTPDGTRPGKRLHNELERSTMRKSWENPLFRLGHGFNSYVNVYQRVMEPYGNHPIIILIQNLHLSSSGLGNFPIDASKPLLRWFIHGRFIETMVYRC